MRTSRRRALGWLAKLAFLGLVVWLAVGMLRGLKWAELSELLRNAEGLWLAVTVGWLVARPLTAVMRWRLALRRLDGAPGVAWTYGAVSASLLVDHVTPTARLLSSVFRSRWLGRRPNRRTGAVLGSVLYEQIVHEIVMGLATIAGLVIVPAWLGRWDLAGGVAGAGVLFLVGVVLWTRRHGGSVADGLSRFLARRAQNAEGRWESFFQHGGDAVEVIRRLAGDVRLGAWSFLWSVGFLACNVLAQWAAFRAIGVDPGFLVVFAVLALGLTAGVLAGTPGGVGATEAVLVGAYVALGVDPADAAAGALLYRGLHYGVVAVLGLPPVFAFELSKPKRSKTSANSDSIRSRDKPSSSKP